MANLRSENLETILGNIEQVRERLASIPVDADNEQAINELIGAGDEMLEDTQVFLVRCVRKLKEIESGAPLVITCFCGGRPEHTYEYDATNGGPCTQQPTAEGM